jgi:hypothetical protein
MAIGRPLLLAGLLAVALALRRRWRACRRNGNRR